MIAQVLAWIAIAGVAVGVALWQRRAQGRWNADHEFARVMRRRYGRAA